MGDLRFYIGTIQALWGNRHYNCELAVKIAEDNIERIKQGYNQAYSSPSIVTDVQDKPRTLVNRYGTVNDPVPQDWTVLNDDGYIYFAGKVPWISRDNIVFPFALPSDGLLDLMIVKREGVSKAKATSIMLSFDDASHVNMEGVSFKYFSCQRE
jgi:sphingosine kinase